MLFANWKMNMNWQKASSYVQTMLIKASLEEQSRVVFLPPAFLIPLLRNKLKHISTDEGAKKHAFHYGGQNCHFEDQGAFTGENSPLVLKELGATYCLAGHSERRTLFLESNALVQKKTKALIKHGLKPVVCVGETKKERRAGQTFKILKQQISPILEIEPRSNKTIYIAYEPVWAIGTGHTAQAQDIAKVSAYVRQLFADQAPTDQAQAQTQAPTDQAQAQTQAPKEGQSPWQKCLFLYGGSVNENNIRALSKIPGVDGFLLGGASLNPEKFLKLLKMT